MRNRRAPLPRSTFRAVGLRLASGILMLALLAMLINWVRQADNWQWLVRKPAPVAAQQAPVTKTEPLPEAAGPTDEDPDEAETARENFQALTDGSTTLGPEEMVPYNQLVEWVKNQSFARLDRRARRDLWYTDLHDQPNKHRGKLVALDLDIRMAKDVGRNEYGVPLHEAWGFTQESRGRPYTLIILDYPKGMPEGYEIRANARFAGYFLKLQGYEPAKARPGQRPERAPLLIGRLQWTPPTPTTVDEFDHWAWGGALVGLVVVALAIWYFQNRRTMATLPSLRLTTLPGASPIDQWLEQRGDATGGSDGPRHGEPPRGDSLDGPSQ
ncbi:MAG: hypothetical protein ABFC63_05245 [Thermoguttaceae bacterium]